MKQSVSVKPITTVLAEEYKTGEDIFTNDEIPSVRVGITWFGDQVEGHIELIHNSSMDEQLSISEARVLAGLLYHAADKATAWAQSQGGVVFKSRSEVRKEVVAL